MVSPNWQTVWMESRHCSKSVINVNMPSQQTKKVLEDLRTNCCSSNKTVQLEALKCWGMWINNQNNDDWKLNTVCFMAVRPLITKKMQPLHKDVDICKLKLSLMWALLVKVQNIMQLEGPQYILEGFLQSCLSWLSSSNGEEFKNEISVLIFQLLLSVLQKNETVNDWDTEMFTPLTTDILQVKSVFHCLADKFLNIFIYWRKIPDKVVFLKLWKCFLEHCELSCEHIPVPIWHKVFKLADQICSEKNEPVKERLAFLHSCATVLKSALSSSKFIDFGNLLTTPCEALFKKLMELCMTECSEFCDLEIFVHSKEICQVLSDKSVAISGFDLCISVLDVLEEFWLKDLYWGVWCGLVYCYKTHLVNVDRRKLSKVEMKFYRKLRGVAVNFELDRDALHKDCINEVERHIGFLNINCLRPAEFNVETSNEMETEMADVEPMEVDDRNPLDLPSSLSDGHVTLFAGEFPPLVPYKNQKPVFLGTETLKADLIKDILKSIQFNSKNAAFDFLFGFQLLKAVRPVDISLRFKVSLGSKEELNLTLSCLKAKSSPVPERTLKKKALALYEGHRDKEKSEERRKKKRKVEEEEEEEEETVISTPKTRSRSKAEEEKKKELESQKRKTRKSFEDLVQEIVRKNKERKTEKNSTGKRPILAKNKKMKKTEKSTDGKPRDRNSRNKLPSTSDRKLRHSDKEEQKPETPNRKSFKADGKLENYFKVITKKSMNEARKEKKKPQKGKKSQEKRRENTCCNPEKEETEKKGEIGWRQTSLKTMMSRRKTEKLKQNSRPRNRPTDFPEEKPKKVINSPLSKLSPFKEVFHDHEYAKIEPQDMETFERVLQAKRERRGQNKKEKSKPSEKPGNTFEPEQQTDQNLKVSTTGELTPTDVPVIMEESEETKGLEAIELQTNGPELKNENLEVETEVVPIPAEPGNLTNEVINVEGPTEAIVQPPEDKIPEIQNYVISSEEAPESLDSKNAKRGKKRSRTMKDERPSKRPKPEEEDPQEEKLPPEVTEKENLEEKQTKVTSPIKTASGVKGDGTPKTTNGMISSRALRMIALVPESTKGSQMHREATSKLEFLKCKKLPNMDKNSRASKMLALLSENVAEVEEVEEKEEISSRKEVTTPDVKTPVSSLKSPLSVKKRRSIRFDDAKNETVLYQTDTPPSQILEEKEKCRRIKLPIQ